MNLSYYLQDLNQFYFSTILYQETGYLVKRNKAVLNDNIFFGSLGMTKEINFYSANNKYNKFGSINLYNQYMYMYFAVDQEVNYYR